MDITIDLETCALCPTAAVMSIGAVAWNRNGDVSPFYDDRLPGGTSAVYDCHIDLRKMFVDGFSFDAETQQWWAKKSREAKDILLSSDVSSCCEHIDIAVSDFFRWMERVKEESQEQELYLWAQGSDFDIAILRNICKRYNLTIPVSYRNFRDHRTFFLEGSRLICEANDTKFDDEKAYSLVDYDGDTVAHSPVDDCKKSIYYTWQMSRYLKSLISKSEYHAK